MSLLSVQSTGEFPQLNNFKLPMDFEHVSQLSNIIAKLPFKKAEVDACDHSILLPSLDIYRKFLNGLAFFNGQIPDDEIGIINEAMVKAYDLECRQKYQGQYLFNLPIYVVTAEK